MILGWKHLVRKKPLPKEVEVLEAGNVLFYLHNRHDSTDATVVKLTVGLMNKASSFACDLCWRWPAF